jgi:hypothetical protein
MLVTPDVTEARRTAIIFAATARIASQQGAVRSQFQATRLLHIYEEIMSMDAEMSAPISPASIAKRMNCRAQSLKSALNALVSIGVIERQVADKPFQWKARAVYRPVFCTDFK